MGRRVLGLVTGLFTLGAALGACAPRHVAIHHVTPPAGKARERGDGAVGLYAPALPFSAQTPAFSPDGSRLVFTLYHDGFNTGPASIDAIPFNGGAATPLFDDSGHASVTNGATWSGHSGRVVFSSDQGGSGEIWSMKSDGTGAAPLTNHPAVSVYRTPTFSPDGQWISFLVDAHGPTGSLVTDGTADVGGIWKMRSDGSDMTQLTFGLREAADDSNPQWSPAGDRILFQRRTELDQSGHLYIMAADGSDVRPVTVDAADDNDASWSPDGKWIVYSSDQGQLDAPNIFIVSVNGGDPVRVTNDSNYEDLTPAWSPDGRWIVFQSHLAHSDDPSTLWRIAVPQLPTDTPPPLPAITPIPWPIATPTDPPGATTPPPTDPATVEPAPTDTPMPTYVPFTDVPPAATPTPDATPTDVPTASPTDAPTPVDMAPGTPAPL